MRVARVVVSPDAYLYVEETGEYVWSPERVKAAWSRAYAQLRVHLADPGIRAVVLMVGIPASGKSTYVSTQGRADAVYFDATFTTRRARKPVIQMAKAAGRRVEAVVMKTPVAVCLDRNRCRSPDRRIPEDVIDRMQASLLADPPRKGEGFDSIQYFSRSSVARVVLAYLTGGRGILVS